MFLSTSERIFENVALKETMNAMMIYVLCTLFTVHFSKTDNREPLSLLRCKMTHLIEKVNIEIVEIDYKVETG